MLGSNTLINLFTLSSRTFGVPEDKLDKVGAAISRSAHEIAFEVLHAEAEKLARMVKEEIDAQPPVWPDLNPAYKKWKEKMGLNTDMLKATEEYYNSISVQEVRNSLGQFSGFRSISDTVGFSIRVGVPYSRHPGLDPDEDDSENIKFTELAEILEYGTEHIPARPHWSTAYQRWRSQHARSIRARITSLFVRQFHKLFRDSIVPEGKARKSR